MDDSFLPKVRLKTPNIIVIEITDYVPVKNEVLRKPIGCFLEPLLRHLEKRSGMCGDIYGNKNIMSS